MIKKILISIFLLLAIVFTTHAQQHCFFTHYSTEDGLSQNTVMNILQDHKDNLWFATWDGINRFDGYTFKTYKARQGNYISLTNNRVDRMYEDCYGFLWLLTYDNRVHRFNPKTEAFEQVPAAGEEGSTFNVHTVEVMPNGTVWLLTENDGAIRILTCPDEDYRLTCDIYSAKTGLFPSLHVFKVHQDKDGNDWLLTDNGLGMIRPGGKEPDSYFTETKGRFGGMNQAFYAVQERDEDICFASNHGRIWSYRKESGEFTLFELPTKGRITSIHPVRQDVSVVTTDSDGFFTYDLKTKKFVHYSFLTCKELPARPILSAYVDRSSEVWFEQEEPGVVAHFNPETGVVTCERLFIEYSNPERSRPAFHIHEDVNGYLWVHPYGGGFSYFDPKQKKLLPFYNGLGSRDWRFSNKIHSAFSDKQGNLWLCTHSKGLEKVTFRNVPFSMMTPVPHEYESLHNEVRALCEDKLGNLWVGLKDGMLRVYGADKAYKGYLTETGVISATGVPMRGTAYFVIQDSRGVIWIATKGDGLVRAEPCSPDGMSYKLTRYLHHEEDMYSLSDNNVYCVYEDRHDRIWVATFGGGINYITESEEGKTLFINHRNNLKGYPIDPCYKARFITSDCIGRLWVGTTTGAVAFDEDFEKPEDVRFYHFSRVPNDTQSLSNNDVHWIIPTRDKELYLATFGGGLNKLVSVSKEGHGTFKSYSVKDGLSSDVLLSIREDHKRNLWISTENGICKFNPSEECFESFDERSITFPVRFSEAASVSTSGGSLLFGASGGIFMFNPDSIRKSGYIPPIVFSKLTVANEDVAPGDGKSLLEVDIDDTGKLVLSHDENIFSVHFAALDYTNPQNVQYSYILDGFEKQWTFADKQRSVTYTNLPKGEYVLRIRSTNSDGVWVDNERTLDIVILPSFWETPVAYVLYVLFILIIILVAVYILFTIYRLKHEVSVEQQISDIKLRFFTNISHELRTPLTLIAGPVEQVLKNDRLPADAREQLMVVERNTNRMLRLVNQILDFRKIQNKKMKMQVQRVDIVPFIRKVMDNFKAVAEEHRIDFLFETEKEHLCLWVDADKLEKIVFNLLSNAFKYTPNGKMITIFIREDENTVSVGVQDQGIGIAENKRKSLFVRFENLVDRNLFNQASTGIGLSLVKELVEMHKATISVDSRLGEGSCFKVDFLKGKDHYDKETEFILEDSDAPVRMGQVVDIANSSLQSESLMPEDSVLENISSGEGREEGDNSKELMLLVEDNLELRGFLRSIFIPMYRVVEAADGAEGLDKALKYLPDIVISDVMMPEKDGIEMVRELRADMTTSHIPVILLTAKTTIESKLEGLEYGADDYITKPFSAIYLQARVENLLVQRKKLQNFYRDSLMHINMTASGSAAVSVLSIPEETGQPEPEPSVPDMSPNDRKFMDKLLELMERNMDNGELVVDDLVRELAVSRSVFFKKLKTLTGLAPIEFIKEMRIKRAAQLIETGEFNMTQISYMVGINDPRYFSKCFKAQVGMTPTEYRDKVGK